jgi:hypothetical protein
MKSREDYIERQIAMLRQGLEQILKLRSGGHHEQAMMVLMQAQEKLFGCPPSQFAALAMDDQLKLLAAGVSPEEAREKYVGYALLLREAGISYAQRDRNDLSASAFKAALYVLLHASLKKSGGEEALLDLIRTTLASTPTEAVDAPIREMLEAINS